MADRKILQNSGEQRGHKFSIEYFQFSRNTQKSRAIYAKNEYRTPRVHKGIGSNTNCKKPSYSNLKGGISQTESVNRALRVMRLPKHTGLKLTPFELHHGRKSRT